MDRQAGRWVRYTAPGAPVVEVSWDDAVPELGIWSRADADLLCIEPWHGMSSPVDFDGDFHDKPGIMLIHAADARRATYRIRVAWSGGADRGAVARRRRRRQGQAAQPPRRGPGPPPVRPGRPTP